MQAMIGADGRLASHAGMLPRPLHPLPSLHAFLTRPGSTVTQSYDSRRAPPSYDRDDRARRRGGGGGRDSFSSRSAPPAPRYDRDSPSSSDSEMWWNRLMALKPTARSAALEQLLRIEEDGAFAGLVGGAPPGADGADPDDPAAARAAAAKLDDRDRRRVTEIVSGVTRWRRRLDWVLSQWLRAGQLEAMDAPLRQLLRMGAYELLELGLAPHAINEHVELAKRVMHEGCGTVANSVLRKVAAAGAEGRLPRPPPPPAGAGEEAVAAAMGVASSHPDWLALRWLRRFGRADAMALLQSNNA
jgi:16S rRNA (cytosine967-C5)-methyltransferase